MINTTIYRVKENFFPSMGIAKRDGFSKDRGKINNGRQGEVWGSSGRNRLDNRLQSSSSSSISVILGPDTQRNPTVGCLSEGSNELRNLHLEWIR